MAINMILRAILSGAHRLLARAVLRYSFAATLMAIYGGPLAATLFLVLVAIMCYVGTQVIDWAAQT